MKLRVSGQSVRLRLSQEDVTEFLSAGKIEEVLEVEGEQPASWSYSLVASAEDAVVGLTVDDEGLGVRVPAAEAMEWAASDRVGLYGEAGGLEVKIEKDLGCDHESGDPPKTH